MDGGVLCVAGDLDIGVAGELELLAHEHFVAGRPVALDLSGVGFMDSSGVGTLVSLWQRAGADADSLTIRATSEAVHRVLEITGLLEVLNVS